MMSVTEPQQIARNVIESKWARMPTKLLTKT